MAFIDQMRGKLTQAGQNTMQKAKELSEMAKLNNTIAVTERQIQELYAKIGYTVYCAYRETPLPEAAELIEETTKLHQTMESCKAQIRALNAAEVCPTCGAKISKSMVFCSSCGTNLQHEEPKPAEAENAYCANCGAALVPGAVFCTSCGEKIV